MDHKNVSAGPPVNKRGVKVERVPRYGLRKLSVGLVSCMLGGTMMLVSPVAAVAAESQPAIATRSIDPNLPFAAQGGEENPSLRYAGLEYKSVDDKGNIVLNETKWVKLATGWGHDDSIQLSGQYLLYFDNPDFYNEVASISAAGKPMNKVTNVDGKEVQPGKLWSIGIANPNPFDYAKIGIVTNHDIVITLKDGQTLDSLGLADTPVNFGSVWLTDEGLIDPNGSSNGFILKNNDKILPDDQYYSGLGRNFCNGEMIQNIIFDQKTRTIRSVHTFKPDQNFLQSNYSWLLYVKERVPAELLKYIKVNDVKLGVSDKLGNYTGDNEWIDLNVDDSGLVDSSRTPAVSIADIDTSSNGDKNAAKERFKEARTNLDNKVFWGTLGQSRNYTISYTLKDDIDSAQFVRDLAEYVKKNGSQLNVDSWLEADFPDSFIGGGMLVGGNDNGDPTKMIKGSYANAFIDLTDSDGDGIPDFSENNMGTNPALYDTDGDGRSDGDELTLDQTGPVDPKSFKVGVGPLIPPADYDPAATKPGETTLYLNGGDRNSSVAGSHAVFLTKEPSAACDSSTGVVDPNSVQQVSNSDTKLILALRPYDAATKKFDATATGDSLGVPDKEYNSDAINAGIDHADLLGKIPAELVIPDTHKLAPGDYQLVVYRSADDPNPVPGEVIHVVADAPTALDATVTAPGPQTEGQAVPAGTKVVEPNKPGSTIRGDVVAGMAVNPQGELTGTPTIDDWKDGETERVVKLPVTVTNGSETKRVEVPVTVKRPQAALDATVTAPGPQLEGEAITPVKAVEPNRPGSVITSTQTNGILVDGQGQVVGTPSITDWGATEEERTVQVPVRVTNGGETKDVVVNVTVQRDTDGDGIPDVTDPDDDNDGFTDEDEKKAGTDPKDPNSKPQAPAALDVAVKNPTPQLEGKGITPVTVVTPNKEGSTIKGTIAFGMAVNPQGKLTGTPTIDDWGKDEEQREVELPVKVTNGTESKDVVVKVTVLRDTDGDGIPDVTDPDDDNDGFTDEDEKKAGTDPKDPNSKPQAPAALDVAVKNPTPQLEGKGITPVTVVTPNKEGSTIKGTIAFGMAVNPQGKLTGTPTIDDWGKDEEQREVELPVKVTNGTESKDVVVKVTVLRDTDGDGIPDVTDPDDDNDGVTDEDEKKEGTDPKDPNSKPAALDVEVKKPSPVIEDQDLKPEKVVTPNKKDAEILFNTDAGCSVDSEGNTKGHAIVNDWGKTEEQREVTVPGVVKYGSEKKSADVVFTVLRDTDNDGIPDVTDPDDDNDGVSDEDEIKHGTDPKDPSSKPVDFTLGNGDQTIKDGDPIKDMPVTKGDKDKIDLKGPDGLTYDEDKGVITGTPTIDDWGKDEEERTLTGTVTVTYPDGSTEDKEFTITVQRDTDGDGTPDVTDPDDDNDGFTDDQENQAGTDPKDPNSKPENAKPEAPSQGNSSNGNGDNGGTNGAPSKTVFSAGGFLPKLGDAGAIAGILGSAGAAVAGAVALVFRRRNHNDGE